MKSYLGDAAEPVEERTWSGERAVQGSAFGEFVRCGVIAELSVLPLCSPTGT